MPAPCPPPVDTVSCRSPLCRTPPAAGYADRGLCALCEARGQVALDELPALHTSLRTLVREQPTRPAGPGGTFGPRVPLNLAADTLADEIGYAVAMWEEIVRDRARLPPPRGTEVGRGCRLLAAWWPVLIAAGPTPVHAYAPEPAARPLVDADGPDGIVWLTWLHRRAVAATGTTALVSEVPGICPACGAPSLRHRDAADTVWCDRCRVVYPWHEYHLHVQLLTGDQLLHGVWR